MKNLISLLDRYFEKEIVKMELCNSSVLRTDLYKKIVATDKTFFNNLLKTAQNSNIKVKEDKKQKSITIEGRD